MNVNNIKYENKSMNELIAEQLGVSYLLNLGQGINLTFLEMLCVKPAAFPNYFSKDVTISS